MQDPLSQACSSEAQNLEPSGAIPRLFFGQDVPSPYEKYTGK